MPDYFPALTPPTQLGNEGTAFIGGLTAGSNLYRSGVETQAQQLALENAREKKQALQEYTPGGDITGLYKAAPELAQQLETHFQTMDKGKLELTVNQLKAPMALTDAALPHLMAATPEQLVPMYNNFYEDLKKTGFNTTTMMPPTTDPVAIKNYLGTIYNTNLAVKTAVANAAGQYKLGAADLAGRYRLAAEDKRIQGAKEVATIKGPPGQRFPSFPEARAADLLENPNMSYNDSVKKWYANKYNPQAEAKQLYPPPPKPRTPAQDALDKARAEEAAAKARVKTGQAELFDKLKAKLPGGAVSPTVPALPPGHTYKGLADDGSGRRVNADQNGNLYTVE